MAPKRKFSHQGTGQDGANTSSRSTVIKNPKALSKEELEEFIYAPVIIETETVDSADVKSDMIVNKDWIDLAYPISSHLNLEHLETEEILVQGNLFLNEIHSSISKRTIARLFLLAYNIKDRSGASIMPDPDPVLYDIEKMVNVDEVDEEPLRTLPFTRTYTVSSGAARRDLLATAYTFLAASYLRLFTKSAHNYSILGNRLKDTFRTLYGAEMPFEGYHPREETINVIKSQFGLDPIFKDTFYIYLHCGIRATIGEGVRKFLYDIHVDLHGLHPIKLFCDLIRVFNVVGSRLASFLHSNVSHSKLVEIAEVHRNFLLSNAAGEKKMWRYARLFDQTFLSSLQAKHCKLFTLILAYTLRCKGGSRHKGVLEIAQIKDASEDMKEQARLYALRAVVLYYDWGFSGPYTGLSRLFIEELWEGLNTY